MKRQTEDAEAHERPKPQGVRLPEGIHALPHVVDTIVNFALSIDKVIELSIAMHDLEKTEALLARRDVTKKMKWSLVEFTTDQRDSEALNLVLESMKDREMFDNFDIVIRAMGDAMKRGDREIVQLLWRKFGDYLSLRGDRDVHGLADLSIEHDYPDVLPGLLEGIVRGLTDYYGHQSEDTNTLAEYMSKIVASGKEDLLRAVTRALPELVLDWERFENVSDSVFRTIVSECSSCELVGAIAEETQTGGEVSRVQTLVDACEDIEPYEWETIVRWMVESVRMDLLEWLVSVQPQLIDTIILELPPMGVFCQIFDAWGDRASDECIMKVFKYGCESGRDDIAEYVAARREVHQSCRDDELGSAAISGDLKLLTFIHKLGTSQKAIDDAFGLAVLRNHEPVLHYLQDHVSQAGFESAFVLAKST